LVTAAGVLLIVIGALLALFGLLFLLVGSQWRSLMDNPDIQSQVGTLPASFGGIVTVVGAILFGLGGLEIVSGAYVFLARQWARITGMVVSTLLGLFWLLNVVSAGGSRTLPLVLLATSVFVVWALASNGRYFRRA
jgi:hypothetical protein